MRRLRSRLIWTVVVALASALLIERSAVAEHAVTFSQSNGNAGGIAIRGTATGGYSGHGAVGVLGKATAASEVYGVLGSATATSGPTRGVRGQTLSPDGEGVVGISFATTGSNKGVAGLTYSSSGIGVWGRAIAINGTTRGVLGETASKLGQGVLGQGPMTGVEGVAMASTFDFPIFPTGVRGVAHGMNGRGVMGEAAQGTAVWGVGSLGVRGTTHSAGHSGVFGDSNATTGTGAGVQGFSNSDDGFGVLGHARVTGVLGRATSQNGRGVVGTVSALDGETIGVLGIAGSPGGKGVLGDNTATTGTAVGVRGQTASTSGRAIVGVASAATGQTIGVRGLAASTAGIGVEGEASARTGNTTGVRGEAASPNGAAIRGIGNNGARAGLFSGRVDINCATAPCLFVNGGGVADLAEDMPVAEKVSAGDVVVLTRTRYSVVRSSRPYDTLVAGIISGTPRIRFGLGGSKRKTAPVAMVGVVRAKATASSGAIRIGDLLTTSAQRGRLMRCSQAVRCIGAIVGKALQALPRGQGEIHVLLWRQ